MFFILGPTAIGKSEIAAEVASRCNAEIVGADAFQIYAGLDLLTAKPGAALREKVPHHLIGEIPLAQPFDAAQYRDLALVKIGRIEARGKRALIVGGTGLYIRALTHGLSELPKTSPVLRRKLDAMPLPQLQQTYATLDPKGYERIDRQNPRRLVRAIEVCLLTGQPCSSLRADWSGAETTPTAGDGVIVERHRDDLYDRIDQRVRRMFAEGVIDEVRAAGQPGITAEQAIGYREIRDLLRGNLGVETCIAAIQQRTRQYAKRQLTWLRGGNSFFKINLTTHSQSEVTEIIAQRILAGAAPGIVGPIISPQG